MATRKRDTIREERIQNPSAPRAEPRAVKLAIPRRELLTGGALALVASGCGGGAPAAAAAPQRFRTQFTEAFTAQFIGDPTKILDPAPPPQLDPWPDPRIWPAPNQLSTTIRDQYLTFVNVLMTVGYVLAPAPNAPPGSLGDQIAQFLQKQNWPAQAPTFVPDKPPVYDKEDLTTVHLVEIAVIQDRLLQAINSYKASGSSKGGGGSNWPPH